MEIKKEKKIIKTAKDLEKIMILMRKHKVDRLEIEDKIFVISKHDMPKEKPSEKSQVSGVSEDEYFSNTFI